MHLLPCQDIGTSASMPSLHPLLSQVLLCSSHRGSNPAIQGNSGKPKFSHHLLGHLGLSSTCPPGLRFAAGTLGPISPSLLCYLSPGLSVLQSSCSLALWPSLSSSPMLRLLPSSHLLNGMRGQGGSGVAGSATFILLSPTPSHPTSILTHYL